MNKLRVYEYAKQLNMSSKEIITILSRLNIPVNNHMSVMEPPMVQAVEGFFSDVKARAAARTAVEHEKRQARELERAKAQAAQEAAQAKLVEGEANGTGRDTVMPIQGETQAASVAKPKEESVPREPIAVRVPAVETADVAVRDHRDEEQGNMQITGARSTQGMVSSRPASTTGNAGRRPQTTHARAESARESTGPEVGAVTDVAAQSGNTSTDRPATSTSTGYQGRSGSSNRDQAGSGSARPPRSYADGERRPYQGSSPRPAGDRPSYGDRNGSSGGSRPDGGYPARTQSAGGGRPPGSGGYAGNRSQGGSATGQRPASTGGSSYGGNRPQGGGGYAGSRPGGSSGGARPATGGGGGGYGANRPQGGGNFGADRRPSSGQGVGAGRSSAGRTDNRRPGGASTGQAAVLDRSAGNASGAGSRNKRNGDRNQGTRNQSDKRENNRKLQPPRRQSGRGSQVVKAPEGPRQVTIDSAMTVGEFARVIRREASEVIKKLLFLGTLVTINQEIDTDTMVLVGGEFGTEVIVLAPRDIEAEEMLHEDISDETLEHRPPVVTIMGHVDHGKTTLLDVIRETNVTASEAGGITQHIGAYQVEINHKKITFLDTPGHAAFTTMRARGAQVTDITILVVAADDGVMPQTVEAIDHAKAANVPIIVAINKMDKPGANPDRVKQELTEHGLVAEEWGGDTIFVPISALQRQGIEELLEMVLLVAEVADLKSSPTTRARGTVIEAELDKGRGPVATVLVQNGTLRIGDVVVIGNAFGKIRAMVNDRGRRVKEAGPSAPVEIIGLSVVPGAGDQFVVYDDERQARQVSERRTSRQRAEELGATSRVTLDDLYKQIQEGEVKDLNLILKSDVQGSSEAVHGALQKLDITGVRVRVIHNGVGAITESDILLASASNAIVIGFNVRPEPNASKLAEANNVEVRLYRVIYSLIEEIEAALKGMLDPVYKEVIVGRAEVRQLFKVSKVGTIAGALVQEGKLVRDGDARLIRGGVVIHEGKIDTLKRFKDDVREVATGYECGFTLERFNDLKEGDIVEAFKMEAVKAE